MNDKQDNRWSDQLRAQWAQQGLACADDEKFSAGVDRLLLLGTSIFPLLAEHSVSLYAAWQGRRLSIRSPEPDWTAELRQHLAKAGDDVTAFAAALRHFFGSRQLEIVWLDLVERAASDLVSQRYTRLAEVCLSAAADFLYEAMTKEHGVPRNSAGQQQRLVAIGLGRLGGRELTAFGPLKLILTFTGHGHTDIDPGLTNERFFQLLAERLVALLNGDDGVGAPLRIDLGLRPRGDDGPICLSGDAFEHYFETEGRAHHRFMLIKARPVAGDLQAGLELLNRLRPFVYRRYLDFNMVDALRRLKRAIDQDKADDANLEEGSGGLRELEFVVRALQLVRGGRHPSLQTESLHAALVALADVGGLSPSVSKGLREAHSYLLRVANRLQTATVEDNYRLPENDFARAALVAAMDYASWEGFISQLDQHRQFVETEFRALFAKAEPTDPATEQWQDIWEMAISPQHAQAQLSLRGFVRSAEAVRLIEQLRSGPLRTGMSERSAQRLDQVMPTVLAACNQTDDPDGALERIFDLLKAIKGRSTYIALLAERPAILSKLVALLQAGPWIARELTRYPVLLDDVLDARSVLDVSTPAALNAGLAAELRAVPLGDLEAEMDAMRRFRRSATLQIARRRLAKECSPQDAAHSLVLVAECIVQAALAIAWRDLCEVGGEEQPPLAVLGYGSLGAHELAFGSGLDLGFLRDDKADPALCIRCAQRTIHILTAVTSTGRLFSVDCSKRPYGDAGTLVPSVSAFAAYYDDQASVGNLVSVLRARRIAGNSALGERFDQVRAKALSDAAEIPDLATQLAASRATEAAARAAVPMGQFDLYLSAGGLLDVLYLTFQLALADAMPGNPPESNTRALLSSLRARSMHQAGVSNRLRQAYDFYSQRVQLASLSEQSMQIPQTEAEPHASTIKKIWAEKIGHA